ncbi:MAG: glutamate synthase-related protein [Acidobacteriota bacterium]
MPERYHIHTRTTPGRFHRIGKFGGVDFREDCSRCKACVKPRCTYDVYEHESAHNRDPLAAKQPLYECKACLSCVQGCTKGLLNLSINPEYLEMGDEYWRPDLIATSWNQADTGKIPVSGAGYRGPFRGPGFDSIWTDMSEIVRPTRDGIHGREYISTSVDIGPKPMRLSFSADGKMLTPPAHLLELPLPVILDIPAWPVPLSEIGLARAMAARNLKTVAVLFAEDAQKIPESELASVVPILSRDDIEPLEELIEKTSDMVQFLDGPDLKEMESGVREVKPQAIVSIRMTLRPNTADRILELAKEGFRVFHLCADLHGCERTEDGKPGRHIKDALRDIHGRLVDEGLRDEITLITSGGIALAEHMAKAIICGSDLIAADTALLVSIGCRVCYGAQSLIIDGADPKSGTYMHRSCAVIGAARDPFYAAQRMVNLMGAWHSQLIEVLGAMGIREVRRLRGEVGRAIFAEDIEKEAFGDMEQVTPQQVCA